MDNQQLINDLKLANSLRNKYLNEICNLKNEKRTILINVESIIKENIKLQRELELQQQLTNYYQQIK